MATSFRLDLLQPGMTLRVPIFHQGGQLLAAGATISERHLRQLRAWNVESFDVELNVESFSQIVELPKDSQIEVYDIDAMGLAPKKNLYSPPGYEIDNGSTLMVESNIEYSEEEIFLEKNIILTKDIGAGVRIKSSGFIKVAGNVAEGASIESERDIVIQGGIKGSVEKPVFIKSESATVNFAEHSKIEAIKFVKAKTLKLCEVKSNEIVEVDEGDGVIGGKIEAGIFIRISSAEGVNNLPVILSIVLQRQKQLFSVSMNLKKAIEEKMTEMSKLEKVIEVIRLLGDKVTTLPQEKKQELALQSKRYMELKNEISEYNNKLQRIEEEISDEKPSIEKCPILIHNIKPSIELLFGSVSLTLNSRQGMTGYYLRNNRVFAVAR